jgi:hypothetical protein
MLERKFKIMAKKRTKKSSNFADKFREKIRKQAKESDSFGNSCLNLEQENILKLHKTTAKNKLIIDIIPYRVGKNNPNAEPGEIWHERVYFTHRNIGINSKDYICPLHTAGKPCPICEYLTKLKDSDTDDGGLIKKYKPKKRQLFNVIDTINSPDEIKVLESSFYVFGETLKRWVNDQDPDDELDKFALPHDGFSLKLGVDEETMGEGITFPKVNRIMFKNRKQQYDESIIDDAFVLDDLLIILDYDQLKEIFFQSEAIGSVTDDEEKSTKKRIIKGKITKKKNNDIEEEEIEEEIEDDEEEIDEELDQEIDDLLEDNEEEIEDEDEVDDDEEEIEDEEIEDEDDEDDLSDLFGDDDEEEEAPKKKITKKKVTKRKPTTKKKVTKRKPTTKKKVTKRK